jgi:hypothetical protein
LQHPILLLQRVQRTLQQNVDPRKLRNGATFSCARQKQQLQVIGARRKIRKGARAQARLATGKRWNKGHRAFDHFAKDKLARLVDCHSNRLSRRPVSPQIWKV